MSFPFYSAVPTLFLKFLFIVLALPDFLFIVFYDEYYLPAAA